MDRYFEPRDWVRASDRRESQSVGMRERPERYNTDREAEPYLERLKLSVSAVVSAWGLYLIMIVGLLVFSAMYPPQVYDIRTLDLGDAIQQDGAADSLPR